METAEHPLEYHPFEPFIPSDARVLIMGTFPPQPKRWSMNFYYPNRTNDFWFMMGLIFMGDRDALYDRPTRTFRLDRIVELLDTHGIALSDTGHAVRRLRDNASDLYLDIVEPVDLDALLRRMPRLEAIATTGAKAADVLAALTDTTAPALGCHITAPNGIEIWRMPSTSRAYPASLADKARHYAALFASVGILPPKQP